MTSLSPAPDSMVAPESGWVTTASVFETKLRLLAEKGTDINHAESLPQAIIEELYQHDFEALFSESVRMCLNKYASAYPESEFHAQVLLFAYRMDEEIAAIRNSRLAFHLGDFPNLTLIFTQYSKFRKVDELVIAESNRGTINSPHPASRGLDWASALTANLWVKQPENMESELFWESYSTMRGFILALTYEDEEITDWSKEHLQEMKAIAHEMLQQMEAS